MQLRPYEEAAAITVTEVRPEFVQASISAATLTGVGEDRGVEVVLKDAQGQSLVVARAEGLKIEQGYTVTDWRPRQLTQEKGSRMAVVSIEVQLNRKVPGTAAVACWSRRLSMDAALQRQSEKWTTAVMLGDKSGDLFACALDQHVKGLYELGLGLEDDVSGTWQVASSLVRVIVEEFQIYSLLPSKAPIQTESTVRINGSGLL